METKTINSEEELMVELERDVRESDKNRIIFQSGHFPLVYQRNKEIEGLSAWGEFSPYSLELSARTARYARSLGKEVRFVLMIDDHINEHGSDLSKYQRSAARNRLYRSRNGPKAILPEIFHNTLKRFGFSELDVIRANHKKSGRENCLYFSEKVLLAQRPNEINECAKAYRAFLDELRTFNLDQYYLISFIPDRCTGNICRGVLERNFGITDSSHISIQTDSTLLQRTDRKSIWENWGAVYRRDRSYV